jgi:hypothetical protein
MLGLKAGCIENQLLHAHGVEMAGAMWRSDKGSLPSETISKALLGWQISKDSMAVRRGQCAQ